MPWTRPSRSIRGTWGLASCSDRRRASPDGRKPTPGGWNRIQLEVDDLEGEVDRLRKAGARFRNTIVTGFGGKQILLDDPAGNPIELFEPPRR
jgi:catechol 2,3-dioxygenase-like lactoylglutathione lyase family enzyme